MTVTLTDDAAQARVRITADGLAAADHATIERSTDQIRWTTVRGGVAAVPSDRIDLSDGFGDIGSNGWGTPDIGVPAWTHPVGAASDYATDGSTASILASAASVLRMAVAGPSFVDGRVEGTLLPGVVATGSDFEQGLILRHVDVNNMWAAEVRFDLAGAFSLRFVRTFAGAGVVVASVALPGTYTAGTQIRCVFDIAGGRLRAMAWNLAGTEPVDWQLVHHDSGGVMTAGQAGAVMRVQAGNTNVPLTVRFDDISAGPRVANVDDYEFAPNVINYYRVRGVETGPITFVASGTPVSSVNASLAPPLPAGIVPGDLLVILASIRNSGTGTVNTPSGWTVLRNLTSNNTNVVNAVLLGRRYQAGDTAPTVTFSGGVAGADTIVQMAAWRRGELTPVTSIANDLNPSAQNIGFQALTIPEDNLLVLVAGWKQDDWTSVAALTGFTEIGETDSIAGDDAGQVWDFQIQTTATNISANSFIVTGGLSAISRSAVVALEHAAFLNEQTANLTPALTAVWLKSPQRPFLNQVISLGGDPVEPDRSARGSVHDVLDRSLPIATSQPAGSRRYTLLVRTDTDAAAQTLEYAIAAGDVLFLHAPAGKVVPAGGVYVRVDRARVRLLHVAGTRRRTQIPVTEVAAPGPDVAYALSTWQTVLNSYATFDDLLAANATWADLLQLIGDPSEVIVS